MFIGRTDVEAETPILWPPDVKRAEQFNFPEGDGIVIKYDDMTLAEADMVKVIGRRYGAHKITRPGRLCNIAKPAAATT